MIKSWGVVCLLFLALVACSHESAEDKQIKATIMRYNQLLIEGYQKMNMNILQEAATAKQAEKVYFHMAALGESRVRMDSTLEKMQFTDVKILSENKAKVKTKEIWDFRHTNIDTKQVVLEEKNFEYILSYELVKEGGRWLVSDVSASEGDSPGHASQPKPAQGRFSSMLREKQRKSMGSFSHP